VPEDLDTLIRVKEIFQPDQTGGFDDVIDFTEAQQNNCLIDTGYIPPKPVIGRVDPAKDQWSNHRICRYNFLQCRDRRRLSFLQQAWYLRQGRG
jgi:hypothetical protein